METTYGGHGSDVTLASRAHHALISQKLSMNVEC